jgi:GNAT superfamily N-acetyltransferase
MTDGIEIRRVLATDGARIRALRLEALADPVAGIAFLETRAHAAAQPEAFWTDRAVGAALSDGVAQFIADAGGRWVGTVTVLRPEPGTTDYFGRAHVEGRALLVAVYVAAGHRGEGLLERLVDAAAAWARGRGSAELALDVHEDNARARAAYRRLGFVETGGWLDGPHGVEREMVRPAAS